MTLLDLVKLLYQPFVIAFYSSRKWLYKKYIGPLFGPIIYFLFSATIAYFYALLIRRAFYSTLLGIPTAWRDIFFENFLLIEKGILEHFLITLLSVIGLFYIGFLIHLFWLPRNWSKKVGLGIAISMDRIRTKDLPAAIQKRKELIEELKNILLESNLSHSFTIKEFNDYQANELHRDTYEQHKYARKVFKKSNIRFIIFGHPKFGLFEGEEKYKHEYEYVISHASILSIISVRLSKDMRETLKAQSWTFGAKEADAMTEATANNIQQNALFSLGASSVLSNQPDTGIFFLEKLEEKNTMVLFKVKAKKYLAIAHYLKAIQAFNQKRDIPLAIEALEKSIAIKDDQYDSHILMSILKFKNNDTSGAIQATDMAQKYSYNQLWRFNKAFLLFYSGERKAIEQGMQLYKSISNNMLSNIPSDAFDQIILSLEERIAEEKYQYFYGLVFVYFKRKQYAEAKEALRLFETHCAKGEFEYIVQEARDIVKKIS